MKYNRRTFLARSGAAAAGVAVTSIGGVSLFSCHHNAPDNVFGLQLWTLRDEMPKDPKGILKQVASYGYKQIETYDGPSGIFWGMSAADFKKYMDELGMTLIGAHCDTNKDFEKKVADMASIGGKYLYDPWLGPQPTLDDYKKKAADFNRLGEITKKSGLRFGYHNHDYSFLPLEGQFPQDVMMSNTDPALVDFQMDIYWTVTAGQDPEAWFKKYKDRFRAVHIKDRIRNSTEKEATCNLGEGSIDFPKILNTARENGVQHFIVEQERYDNSTPLKSTEANANYMKNLKLKS